MRKVIIKGSWVIAAAVAAHVSALGHGASSAQVAEDNNPKRPAMQLAEDNNPKRPAVALVSTLA